MADPATSTADPVGSTADPLTDVRPLRAASLVAGVGAVGAALLGLAHTGLTVPVLSDLGPQGGAVPPAAIAFTVGTVVFGGVAVGLWRARRWAWAGGLVVSALAILSGLQQFRGAASAVGMGVAVVLGVLLVLPASRRAVAASATSDEGSAIAS